MVSRHANLLLPHQSTRLAGSLLACTSPEGFGFMQVHMDQNGGLRSLTAEPLQRVTARHGVRHIG